MEQSFNVVNYLLVESVRLDHVEIQKSVLIQMENTPSSVMACLVCVSSCMKHTKKTITKAILMLTSQMSEKGLIYTVHERKCGRMDATGQENKWSIINAIEKGIGECSLLLYCYFTK